MITGSDIVILLTVIFRYMDSDSDILSQLLIYRISQILRDLGMIFLVVTTHNISYALVLESQSNHEIVEKNRIRKSMKNRIRKSRMKRSEVSKKT